MGTWAAIFIVNIMKNITFLCHYLENPKTHQFHDFSIFGRGSKPQNQWYLSLETLGYLKQIKKSANSFSFIISGSLKTSEIENKRFEETGTERSRRSV